MLRLLGLALLVYFAWRIYRIVNAAPPQRPIGRRQEKDISREVKILESRRGNNRNG